MTDNPSKTASAETPTETDTTTQTSTALAVGRLADIQPDGFVSQVIERKLDGASEETSKLSDVLLSELKTIRAEAVSKTAYLQHYGGGDVRSVPFDLVRVSENDTYRANAVLRYCLARRWQITDSDDEIKRQALRTYQEARDSYDQILGDFIPADFRNEARAIYDGSNFDDGLNNTAADDWPIYRARLQSRRGNELLGLSTGLPALDRALLGLRGFTFLGGGPGAGKTSLALFIAVNALRKHKDLGVVFYSLDMPKNVIYDRLLCQAAGIDYAELLGDKSAGGNQKSIEDAERGLLSEILPRLKVVEQIRPRKDVKTVPDAVLYDIQQLLDLAPINHVLTVVDYFQLLPTADTETSTLDRDFINVGALQRIQNKTRSEQRPAGFPILAISEVRKGESGRTQLGIGDLMGSSRLTFAAGAVLLLDTVDEDSPGKEVPVRLNVAKGRDGAARTKIDLLFEHGCYRFKEAPPPRPARKTSSTSKKTSAKTSPDDKIDPLAGLENT